MATNAKLIQIKPGTVSLEWKLLLPIIEESFNKELTTNESNWILRQIMLGTMQAWRIARVNGDESPEMLGVITTMIQPEFGLEPRQLFVYSLTAYTGIDSEDAKNIMATIEAFAKENACTQIVAYTTSKSVVKIMDKVGFKNARVSMTKEVA